MLHLYDATISTNMMLIARSKADAIKTAKMYAQDEIREYAKVGLVEINSRSLMSEEWKVLYPYIANKCIERQMTCEDLVRFIEQQTIQKPEKPQKPQEPSEPSEPSEATEDPVDQESIPTRPNGEQVPQPGREPIEPNREVKSPKKQDLPSLRF